MKKNVCNHFTYKVNQKWSRAFNIFLGVYTLHSTRVMRMLFHITGTVGLFYKEFLTYNWCFKYHTSLQIYHSILCTSINNNNNHKDWTLLPKCSQRKTVSLRHVEMTMQLKLLLNRTKNSWYHLEWSKSSWIYAIKITFIWNN